MDGSRVGRNDPCPCRSGRKFKHCCARHDGAAPRFSDPPISAGFAPDFGPSRRLPLEPDMRVRAFSHDRREWADARLGDVQPGQEFVAHNRLYHVLRPGVYAEDKLLDVAGLEDADRPYDPRDCRTPKSRDVVYAYAADGKPLGHRLLANLDPGQKCVFQGLVYHIKPGPTPGTGKLVGNGEVDHRPDFRLYVWVEYTAADAMGVAEVGCRYLHRQRILLAGGGAVPAAGLTPGMAFLLEDGSVATVTSVGQPKRWEPDREHRDAHGNGFRRVVGTFKYTGWVPLMSVRVGGETHRVTPGHPYWSETRWGWYPIGTFAVGELLLTTDRRPIPIERVVPPQWEHTTVYNFEVDEYHTYFVGRGDTAVWSHNGTGPLGCGVPKAKEAGLFDHLPDPEGPVAGGVRSLRGNQYNPDAIAVGQVVHGTAEIRAVIGEALQATGRHTDALSGLYAFIRRNGGAGFQGVTRNPLDRPSIVIRNFGESTGDVIAAVHIPRIEPARVFDLRSPAVQEAFLARYPTYGREVNRLAGEGVVAIRGDIPVGAVTGLARFPKNADPATIRAVLLALMGGG